MGRYSVFMEVCLLIYQQLIKWDFLIENNKFLMKVQLQISCGVIPRILNPGKEILEEQDGFLAIKSFNILIDSMGLILLLEPINLSMMATFIGSASN